MNERFGLRTVLSKFVTRNAAGKYRTMAQTQCDCGRIRTVRYDALKAGKLRSCGCEPRGAYTHGASCGHKITPEYQSWQRMRDRCLNPNSPRFAAWGGRGITICPQWDDFAAFLVDMGLKPTPRHSIERRDNDGPYSPENCYWASPKEQARNTRRNRRITLNGETLTVAEWSERTGINRRTIEQRDRNGWPPEKTLTPPRK